MKRILLFISTIIIILGIILGGCFEDNNQNNKQNDQLVTASVLDLLLTIDDLPEDYSELYRDSEYTSEFSRYPKDKPTESFKIGFSKGNSSNQDEYVIITCELNKFNSIEKAEIGYSPTLEYIITTGNFEVINESINIIGNESKAITKEGYDDFLTFRVLNIIGLMSSNNLSYTIELAKIVEQRIYNSIK